MTDPIAQVSTSGAAAVAAEMATPVSNAAPLDPAETQAFSVLMDGHAPAGDMVIHGARNASPLGDLPKALVERGNEMRDRVNELGKSRELFSSGLVDFSDPAMAYTRITDLSLRSTMVMTELNMASNVMSAATSSFNALFKNQG